MELLNTIWLFSFLVLTLICFILPGVVIFILSLLGFRSSMRVLMYKLAQYWSLMLIKMVRCPMTVIGRENIPMTGSLCIVANHGSIFDILPLLAYTGRPFGFIAKKELAFIPFLNIWIWLLGGLFIDRGSPRSALKTIDKGVKRIQAGGSMIIFPEGHRSKGQGLLPFHPGSLKLATKAGAPILHVSITGSYDIFEKHHRVQRTPVKIVYAKPIQTAELKGDEKKQELSDRVYKIILDGLESPAESE